MTNKEAIDILRSAAWLGTDADREQIEKAVEMAINALTKEAWKEEHPVSPLLQKPATTAQPETHEKRTETHGVCLDTIDRQAVLDWLKNEWNGMVTSLFDGIEALPSTPPEIIRCKDCKHQVKEWRADKRLKDKGYMVCGCDVVGDACGYWALLGQDDDFCSYAERKE